MQKLISHTFLVAVFSFVVAFLIICSVLGWSQEWFFRLIYLGYVLSMLYCVFTCRRIGFVFLLYLLYLPLTIIMGKPSLVFRSWERLGLFVIMFMAFSSFFRSGRIIEFRKHLLNSLLILCTIIALICFFCYFLNINLFEDRYYGGYLSDYSEIAGHFSGITRHSMLLGPIAGMSVVYLLDYYLHKRTPLALILLLFCFASMLFAASRAAILATIGGAAISFFSTMRGAKRNTRTIVFVTFIIITLYPVYRPYLNSALNKHQNVETGQLDSRTDKVEARLSEFKQKPLFGFGFSAIDIYGYDEYNSVSGTIEPGSSWLAVLSMTGIIGLVFFLYIFIRGYRIVNAHNNFLLTALMTFFAIHMLVEGYVFSAGNALACIFWLTIGCCYDQDDDKSI